MLGRVATFAVRVAAGALLVVLTVGFSARSRTDPTRSLRAAAQATQRAHSFVATSQQSGEDPLRIVYQAPDRYMYAQSGRDGTIAAIQIGRDQFQADSGAGAVWSHNVLPEGEPGVAVLFTRLFNTLASSTRVTRSSDTYRFRVPTAAVTVVVVHGYLSSVDARITADPGSPRHSKMTFRRIGTAPPVEPPPSSEIHDEPVRAPGP